jgi:hypothetical protein
MLSAFALPFWRTKVSVNNWYNYFFSGIALPVYPAPREDVLLLGRGVREAEGFAQKVNLSIEHS